MGILLQVFSRRGHMLSAKCKRAVGLGELRKSSSQAAMLIRFPSNKKLVRDLRMPKAKGSTKSVVFFLFQGLKNMFCFCCSSVFGWNLFETCLQRQDGSRLAGGRGIGSEPDLCDSDGSGFVNPHFGWFG